MTERTEISGRARKFGDDINTDYIISSLRKRDTLDTRILRTYLFEAIDPEFAATLQHGDVIVAGRNFGCGSAMEIAATVLSDNGVRCIVAESFARTYYRNLVNNGVLPVICQTDGIEEGDTIRVTVEADIAELVNVRTNVRITAEPIPPIMRKIVAAGGLVPLVVSNPATAFDN
jgi:3-isopropylmalate/(R)-2-methylmalate dehydratase small subunit